VTTSKKKPYSGGVWMAQTLDEAARVAKWSQPLGKNSSYGRGKGRSLRSSIRSFMGGLIEYESHESGKEKENSRSARRALKGSKASTAKEKVWWEASPICSRCANSMQENRIMESIGGGGSKKNYDSNSLCVITRSSLLGKGKVWKIPSRKTVALL